MAIRWVAPFAAGVLVALSLVAISAGYPLPIVIGARPVPLVAALALAAALLAIAATVDRGARKPRVDMTTRMINGLLAWWVGALLVVALLTYASWKPWGLITLLVSVAVVVKVIQIASYHELKIGFQVWMPFAAIMGVFALVVSVGQFLARPNFPPPIVAAIDAYGPGEPSLAPSTRSAPDLSSIGGRLTRSGDLDLGGLPATLFTYDVHGSGVDVYVASIGFPAPPGSTAADDPPGWWVYEDGTALRTGPKGTNFLVVAWSPDVADRIAAVLAARNSP
jgi:hypothetical protein